MFAGNCYPNLSSDDNCCVAGGWGWGGRGSWNAEKCRGTRSLSLWELWERKRDAEGSGTERLEQNKRYKGAEGIVDELVFIFGAFIFVAA